MACRRSTLVGPEEKQPHDWTRSVTFQLMSQAADSALSNESANTYGAETTDLDAVRALAVHRDRFTRWYEAIVPFLCDLTLSDVMHIAARQVFSELHSVRHLTGPRSWRFERALRLVRLVWGDQGKRIRFLRELQRLVDSYDKCDSAGMDKEPEYLTEGPLDTGDDIGQDTIMMGTGQYALFPFHVKHVFHPSGFRVVQLNIENVSHHGLHLTAKNAMTEMLCCGNESRVALSSL